MQRFLRIATALLFASVASMAAAQSYPSQPIKIIVPFAPGGTTDAVARTIAHALGEEINQSVIVQNKGGGSTIIGTEALARSEPDGYTIMLATPDFTINPSLRRNLPYDTKKDFTPITLIASYSMVLLVNSESGINSVGDLLALARKQPGALNFASAGSGSMPHLCGELLNELADVKITHVPYKGNGPAITDLLGGRVTMLFSGATPVEGFLKAGKLRALAVTGKERHRSLPDVPTLAESGVPGYEVTAWFGFLAPANVPSEIVSKLNQSIGKALNSAEVRAQLAGLGADLEASTPEQFGTLIDSEISKWAQVVKNAGIEADS